MSTTDNPKSQPPALKFNASVIQGFGSNQPIISMLVFCTKTICFVFTFRAYYGIQPSSIHLVHIIFQPCSSLTTNFSLKQNRENGCFKKKNQSSFSHKIYGRKVECSILTLSWQVWIIHFEELFLKKHEWPLWRLLNEENLKHWENAKHAVSLVYFSKKANSDLGLYLRFNAWRH